MCARSCARFCLLACLHSAAVPPPNRRRSATTTISRHFPVRRRWRRIVRDPFTFRRPGRRRREARRETLRQRSLLRGSRPPMTLRASSRVAPATSMLCRSSLLVPAPLSDLREPRTDHRYRTRARRAAHGFGAGIGWRHRALGRWRHRKRKRRYQTCPHHGQADAAFD